MTVLVEDPKSGELARRDYSAGAWAEVEPTLGAAFSFWRSEYEAVKTEARPEITEKESAENLLRRLCEEDSIMTENTRYILAVMLERKKQLKQTGTRETEEATFLVYEHSKNGEVYIIRDPELKLAQIEEVQKEVSRLLAGGAETPAAPAPAAEGKGEVTGDEPTSPKAAPETMSGESEEAEYDVSEPGPDGPDEVDLEALETEEGDLMQDPDTFVEGGEEAVDLDQVPEREMSGEGLTSEDREERE